jgi:hypothetical protein
MKHDQLPQVWTPLGPLGLTHTGAATWLTDLIVTQKLGEALWRQTALMMALST